MGAGRRNERRAIFSAKDRNCRRPIFDNIANLSPWLTGASPRWERKDETQASRSPEVRISRPLAVVSQPKALLLLCPVSLIPNEGVRFICMIAHSRLVPAMGKVSYSQGCERGASMHGKHRGPRRLRDLRTLARAVFRPVGSCECVCYNRAAQPRNVQVGRRYSMTCQEINFTR